VALDVELTTVRGRWLRHTPAGVDPALRPVPADDNRWQRGTFVDALYLCDEVACVWAEWYRHLAERGIPPQMALPRDLWSYGVDALKVGDLRTAERLARVGLPLPVPGRRGWPAFQAVGERMHADGFAGLVAPSAARPENFVLCVFLPSDALPGNLRPAGSPERVNQVPVPPTGMQT
jgi:hypothetical protein